MIKHRLMGFEKPKKGDVMRDALGNKYDVKEVGMKYMHVVPIQGGDMRVVKVTELFKIEAVVNTAVKAKTRQEIIAEEFEPDAG